MSSQVEYEKAFETLLQSTGELIRDARRAREYSATSKAAIIQSALLIEAAANCCLYHLELNSKLGEELERLPSLTKLDLFLMLKSNGLKTLDRGSKLYQDIREIKKLRDMVVHPKMIKTICTDKGQGQTSIKFEKSKRLGLSLSFSWSSDDAVTVFKIVNEFLNDFFINQCEMNEQEVRLLLLDSIGGDSKDVFLYSHELEKLQLNENIPLTYAGIGIN